MSDTKIARLETELEIAKAELKEVKLQYGNELAHMKESHEKDRAELTVKINTEAAGKRIMAIGLANGIRPDAIDDLVNRAEAVGWTIKNGQLVLSSGDPTGPDEWVKGLRGPAKHLFQQSSDSVQGGGYGAQAGGGGTGVDMSGPNPWFTATWDDMAQAAMCRTNPKRAEAMAKAAGSRVGALDPRLAPSKPAY